jgi:hypothetical protein
MSRAGATIATVALALLACAGLLVLWFATGYGYIDDPPTPDSTIHDGWLWGPAACAAAGVALAAIGIWRERRALWAAGVLLLAAPTITAAVAL